MREREREREEAEAEGAQNNEQLQMMMRSILISARATGPDTPGVPVNQELVGSCSMLQMFVQKTSE